MAKAKPKKAAKPKTKVKAKAKAKPKPKARPKPKPRPAPRIETPRSAGRPLIIKAVEPGSGAGIESGFAIQSVTPFPSDCTVTAVTDTAGNATWSVVGFSFAANNTILRIGIASTTGSNSAGDSGILQIALSNPPADMTSPVAVPVNYIDDLP